VGFTKLDEGILRSSIMAEPSDVFKVWIAFLASCGPDGIARVSAVFISSVCRLDPAVVHKAIERLEAPDPDSRSETEEGRRIKRVDGGWFIVNYDKYRAFSYSASAEAIRARRYRERKKRQRERDERHDASRHSASASVNKNLKCLKDLTKEIEEIKRGWNEFAAKHNLATVIKIGPKSERAKHLAARMAEEDWDFPKLLEIVGQSPFLLGKKSKEPFFVTFDWLLWPGNYQRTMEGNYKDRHPSAETESRKLTPAQRANPLLAGPPLGTWLKKEKEKEVKA
jgi:hypothetical protein